MRKLAALLLGCVVVICAGSAAADPQGTCPPHWKHLDIFMRVSANTSQGYRDSSFFSQATFRAETTASIPLVRFQRENVNGQAASTADSVDFLVLHVTPRRVSGITAGGDSIYVFSQVSMDGSNWSNMTPTRSFQPANALTGGASVLEATSDLNSFALKVKQAYTEAGGWSAAFEGTAPTTLQYFGWRFARWIIYSDLTGVFDAAVDYVSRDCVD